MADDLFTEDDAQRAGAQVNNLNQALTAHKQKLDDVTKQYQEFRRGLEKDFSGAIVTGIHDSGSFGDALTKISTRLEDFALQVAVVNPLLDQLFGGQHTTTSQMAASAHADSADSGLFGSLVGSLTDFFGFRANGGPVTPGAPYVVGERGPELFVPSVAGGIQPQVGGGRPIAITMNIATPDAGSFRASQGQIAGQLMDALQRAGRVR